MLYDPLLYRVKKICFKTEISKRKAKIVNRKKPNRQNTLIKKYVFTKTYNVFIQSLILCIVDMFIKIHVLNVYDKEKPTLFIIRPVVDINMTYA